MRLGNYMPTYAADPDGYLDVVLGPDDVWHAAHYHANGEPDSGIMALFEGHHVLATPYFLPTPREKVVEVLRARGNRVKEETDG